MGDNAAVMKGGIKVGGQNYIFLRSDEGRSIYSRKGVQWSGNKKQISLGPGYRARVCACCDSWLQ